MKEFLKEMLFFKPDDFLSWMIFTLAWLTILFVFSVLGWLLYLGVNYIGVGKNQLDGVIISKTHSNSYITTTYVMSGKVMVPITQYHPESWGLVVEVDSKTDVVGVSQGTHDSTAIGTKVLVTYKKGRFDNEISIVNIVFKK